MAYSSLADEIGNAHDDIAHVSDDNAVKTLADEFGFDNGQHWGSTEPRYPFLPSLTSIYGQDQRQLSEAHEEASKDDASSDLDYPKYGSHGEPQVSRDFRVVTSECEAVISSLLWNLRLLDEAPPSRILHFDADHKPDARELGKGIEVRVRDYIERIGSVQRKQEGEVRELGSMIRELDGVDIISSQRSQEDEEGRMLGEMQGKYHSGWVLVGDAGEEYASSTETPLEDFQLLQFDTVALVNSLVTLSDLIHQTSSLSIACNRNLRGIKAGIEVWKQRDVEEEVARGGIDKWERMKVAQDLGNGQGTDKKLRKEVEGLESAVDEWGKRMGELLAKGGRSHVRVTIDV